MQIQNGRHEITKVSNSSLRIKKETMVFHQTMYVFVIKEYNKKVETFFYILSCNIQSGRHEINKSYIHH